MMKSKTLLGVVALALSALFSTAIAQTAVVQSVENVSNKVQSYTAQGSGYAIANQTDMFNISGSATKTVYVKSVKLSCVKATAGYLVVTLRKTAAATSEVSATTFTAAPHDSSNAAATATVQGFLTTSPKVATGVSLSQQWLPVPASGTMSESIPLNYVWGNKEDQYIVLRGTSQHLAVSFGGQSPTQMLCYYTVSWLEK